jgi:hypothetical protein
VLGEWQLWQVAGVQLQHRDQRNRAPVGLRFEIAAFAATQVEAAGAGDDPFHLGRFLLGDRHRLALVGAPAPVGRVPDVAEALELLGCERFASFDQVALAADGPRFGGWPQ